MEGAISSPLLGDVSIHGATGVIVNITAGTGLSLKEVNAVSSLITKAVDTEADIIVGAIIDDSMENRLSVSIIATGFNEEFSPLQTVSLEKRQKKESHSETKPSPNAHFKETIASRIDMEHRVIRGPKTNSYEERKSSSLDPQSESITPGTTPPRGQTANQYETQTHQQEFSREADKEQSHPEEAPFPEQINNSEFSLREKNDPSSRKSNFKEANKKPGKKADTKENNSSVRDMLLKKAREYASQEKETPNQTKSVFSATANDHELDGRFSQRRFLRRFIPF